MNVKIVSAGWGLLFVAPLLFGQFGRPSLPGNPLAGITAEEFERFRLGLEDFVEVEDADEGLGPAFNGLGCSQCHNSPAIGGVSPVSEVRAGYLDEEGVFHELAGGTLFHLFSLPTHFCQPKIPAEANVISRRIPVPLFGAGLIEAIPDETLRSLEDPDDLDNDGISGRAAVITDVGTGRERVGRFGWKAQHATLLAFGADAYVNEMGITNALFPNEVATGFDPALLEFCDRRPDPEDAPDPSTGLRGIDNFEAFMKLLAPLDRGPIDDTVRLGEAVFGAVGCARCHVPVLMTGRSSNPLFDNKPEPLYSDLLLHSVVAWIGAETEFPLSQAVASGDAFEHRPSERGHCVQDFSTELDLRDLPGEAAEFEFGADDALPTAHLRFYSAALVVPCCRLPGHAPVAADLGNMAIPNGRITRRLQADHCVLWRWYDHIQGLPIPLPQQISCGRSIVGAVSQKARDRGIQLIQEAG